MCVIAFSPKGNDMPTEEQIRKMFKKNPDGAGYAYEEGKTVHYKKGFMSVEDLLEDLGPLEKWKDKAVAMHFRIGTAGKNDKKTTHPFLISSSFGDLRKLEGEGPVLFHNGVISGFGGIIDPLASDTQDFVAGVASHLLNTKRQPSKVATQAISSIIGSSRLLLMYGKGKNFTFGDWHQKDGNYYSNMIWDTTPTYISTTSNYTGGSYYGYDWCKDGPEEVDHGIFPSYYHPWIKVKREDGQYIFDKTIPLEDKPGWRSFTESSPCRFKHNEDLTEWWTETGEKYREDFEADLEDSLDFQEKYGYIYFEDMYQLDDWLRTTEPVDLYEVKKDGFNWYIAEGTLEAYRADTIMEYTECTDENKVIDFLKETGYLPETDEDFETYTKPTEKEEQCVLH